MTAQLYDATLALATTPTAANFYLDSSDVGGVFFSSASQRRLALRAHLERVADGDLLLLGEAAGWRGARQSGVAFTSAHQVGLRGTREPTATVVHESLSALGLSERALLWNTFPLHPHKVDEPRTNRTPVAAEVQSTESLISVAARGRRVVCVGQVAAKAFARATGLRVPDVDTARPDAAAVVVRHPSYGGATEFRSGMVTAASLWSLV